MVTSLSLGLVHALVAPPPQVAMQGRLLNSAGSVPDGKYGALVSLWSAPSGGLKLWEEIHAGPDALVVVDGVFQATLGAVAPLGVAHLSGGAVFVEVQVALEPALPRQPLLSVPFALVSQHAETAAVAMAIGCTACIGPSALDFQAAGKAEFDAVVAGLADLSAKLGAHVMNPDAHHARYTDFEAVDAIQSAAGLTLSGNLGLAFNELREARLHVSAGPPGVCDASRVGFVYYDTNTSSVRVCTGTEFADVGGKPLGTANNPGTSCKAIRDAGAALADGIYWLTGASGAVQAYCDMTTRGGGWTLLMKASGRTFPYDSPHWATNTTLNTGSLHTSDESAKFVHFNELPVSELLLRSGSASTHLSMPVTKTLLQAFQGPATVLSHVAGPATPGELINGKAWSYCGAPWRINTKGNYAAQIRLGGWVTKQWDCSYGADATGQPTGAHLLGFGLLDNQWQPFSFNAKSFGIRDAHDANHLQPGQLEAFGMIFGR